MKKTEQKVIRFIEQNKLINAGDKILVAFSGGPDSVFALNFLNSFKKKYKIRLHAIHFNHSLRGKESDSDEKFASEFCKRNSIPFISISLNVKAFSKKNKISIEEAARKLRYHNLEIFSKKLGCSKIVTAHNLSDNTETILLNLFSGTGLAGLSGIPVRRENIIRPILCLTKPEIVEYLESKKIDFRFDSSNAVDDFKRNYIRNRILPLIKIKLNPAIDEALFRSSKNLLSALSFNEKLAEHFVLQFVTHTKNSASIWLHLLDIFGQEIPAEIIKIVLMNYFNHEFESDDAVKINSLIEKQKGKQIQLSKQLIAVREEESIRIERIVKSSNEQYEIKIGGSIKVGAKKIGIELVESKSVQFSKDGKVEYISGDSLDKKYFIRRWKAGDKFCPLGMKNFKKVSDFLTDLKIPVSEKKNQLVLVNRNHIVWVIGLRIDDRFKMNSKTRKIYRLWVK